MSAAKVREFGLLLLRISGALFLTHGFGKLFGGESFGSNVGEIGKMLSGRGFPLPEVSAWAAAITEFVGGAMIALGVYTRIAASFCAFVMVIGAFVIHAQDSFQDQEPALVYLVIFVALMFLGGGKVSLDQLWRKGAGGGGAA